MGSEETPMSGSDKGKQLTLLIELAIFIPPLHRPHAKLRNSQNIIMASYQQAYLSRVVSPMKALLVYIYLFTGQWRNAVLWIEKEKWFCFLLSSGRFNFKIK